MSEPLPDLDKASLDCVREISKLAGIRNNAGTLRMRATIQIMVREAMRDVLLPDDPRKDRDYPFNQES